ncbi:MAG: DUF1624 domain-containing protein [Spirochaetales bacterium]|nr:DUF1624 domain-containing protein [Spirochaetales bacterium]
MNRINTIDRLRGLSVLLMILANYLKHFDWVPKWMKHAHPFGLTFVDFIAPCFFFIIGMTFHISFSKRIDADGKKAAYRHFRMRSLSLLAIGTMLSLVELLFPFSDGMDVNILQAISLAILIAIPFFTCRLYVKILTGIVIGIGEHFLLVHLNGADYMVRDARFVGVLGWVGLLFLGLAMGDLFFSCRKKNDFRLYWVFGGAYILSGALLGLRVPVFHSAATLSYNLLTTGIISLLFLTVCLLTENKLKKRGFLCIWGSNPLPAFIAHFLLILAVRALPVVLDIKKTFPAYFLVSFVLYFGIMQSLLICLFRKKVYIKV